MKIRPDGKLCMRAHACLALVTAAGGARAFDGQVDTAGERGPV